MKNDFLRSAERFVTVVEAGSIQGAARMLNISQPSLTLAIAKIEEGFGTRLFERGKRGVTLTAAGRILYARAREILTQGTMAQQEIADLVSGQIGRFNIRAGSSWGYCFLPEIVATLKSEFPDLDLTFNIGNTTEAFPQLQSGEIDAIVGKIDEDQPEMPGIGIRELTEIRFVMVCGADHPLAGLPVVRKEDLRDHGFVAYEPDLTTLASIMSPLESDSGMPVNIALRTRSPHAALEMVATGSFVACLSRPFVEKYRGPALRILRTDFPMHRIRSGIFYRETLTPTDPFRRLLTMLKRSARRIETMN